MADGHVIQTGMIGRDGMIGALQAIDGRVSVNKIIVHAPGAASVIDRDGLRDAIAGSSSLRDLVAAHSQFFLSNVQQTAACNALHPIEARAARWILRMMDLVGTDMPLTQEALAAMIGVQRASVSITAHRMQEQGLISYKRGNLRVENAKSLKQSSCECHDIVRENYVRLIGIEPPRFYPGGLRR